MTQMNAAVKENEASIPTAKWLRSQSFTIFMKNCTDSVRCPLCGAHINERIGETWHFCPSCGTRMAD